MAVIKVNEGTQTPTQADVVGTINYPTFKLDKGNAGASSLFTGTIDAVTNLAGGTLGVVSNLTNGTVRVSVGTIVTGTLTNLVSGTVDTIGLTNANAFGTVIASGTSDIGTIKAGVTGSQIFVTDLVVSVGSASNVVIGNGGTNLPIAGTFFFGANQGLVSNFRTPIFTSTGSALVYKQSANGPLTITAQGYVK